MSTTQPGYDRAVELHADLVQQARRAHNAAIAAQLPRDDRGFATSAAIQHKGTLRGVAADLFAKASAAAKVVAGM